VPRQYNVGLLSPKVVLKGSRVCSTKRIVCISKPSCLIVDMPVIPWLFPIVPSSCLPYPMIVFSRVLISR
jgi:hypothetical protein